MKHLSTLFLALILSQHALTQASSIDPVTPATQLVIEGRYTEAIAAFERVRGVDPKSITPLDGDMFGAVYGMANDKRGHFNHCRWLFKRFPLTEDIRPEDAERTAKAYIIYPGAANRKLLYKAEKYTQYAVDNGEGGFLPWFHVAHGISKYRLKKYSEASKWFRRSLENEDPNIRSLALAYQAMCIHRRGYHNKAKDLLNHANDEFALLAKPGTPEYTHQWSNVLTAGLAIAEAEALLGLKE